MLEKMNVWIRRALILGLLLPCIGLALARPPRPARAKAVSQDAARQAVAQAQKLREAAKFAPAQALLEAKLKSLRQPTQQKTLRIALADVHFYWAKSEEAQYRYHEAIRHYQAAYRIDRILRRDYAATDLNNIATAYWNLSLHQEALQFFQQALMAFREVKDRPGEANTLSNIGFVYDSLSRYQEALRYYQQALPIQRAVKDRQGEARTLSNIGLAYLHLSHYEEALRHLQQALPLRRAVKDQQGEAITLNSIGFVYDSLSRYQEALRYYQQVLPIQRAVKDRHGEATVLNNIGTVHAHLSRYEEALSYYQQALPILRKVKDRPGEAATLANIGSMHGHLSRYEEALKYLQQALMIHRAVKNRQGEAATLNNIGSAYGSTNRYEEALRYHQQALPIRRAIKDRSGEAATLSNIGSEYQNMNRHAEALENLQSALLLWREVENRRGEATTLSNIMFSWDSLSKPRLSIFYGKQSVNAYQEIRRNIQGLDKETQQGFLNSKENTYRRLADMLIEEGRLSEAQQVLAMLKEEEFFQFVRRDATQAAANQQATLNGMEATWQQRYEEIADRLSQIGAEYGQLFALRGRTEAQKKRLAELNEDLKVARQAFEHFFTQIQQEFQSQQQTNVQVATLPETRGLQEALRQMGGQVAMLSTVVGPQDYHVILMTAHTIQAFKNPKPVPAQELRRKVLAFREAIEKSRLDPRPIAQELYNVVFCEGKVAKTLEGAGIKTLMWSLDDVLRYAPMSALHDGRKYLVESYAQSVFTLASHSRLQDEPKLAWTALGLGVSKPQANFTALPGVVAEMKAIIRPEGEEKAGGVLPGTVALDEAFTLSALEEGLAEQPQMVHIASHFQFKPGDETDSFLLLGQGTLSLDKLKELSFSGVDLLTLSACDTAMGGKGADGREVESFAELAQRQGAGAVMATLWPVADASTPLLMSGFYRQREQQGGRSKAEALRQAQLALLHGTEGTATAGAVTSATDANRGARSDEGTTQGTAGSDPNFATRFAHPYFWAPFVLIGNWR